MTAGCGLTAAPNAAPAQPTYYAPAGLVPDAPHIFVIVMENLGYQEAMATPGLKALATHYAYLSQSYGVTHPSLPNYLSLVAGHTFGIRSDCWFCYVRAPNLGSQLAAAHISWDAYMEGLPAKSCWLLPWWPTTDYAGKHNPFRYFKNIRSSRSLCGHIEPLSSLTPLLTGKASAVPHLIFITPNLCHDGHDCPASVAAAWLNGYVAKIVHSAAWKQNGILFITWDEGQGSDDRGLNAVGQVVAQGGGGHILTMLLDPNLPHGLVVRRPYNHISLLHTIEAAWHLPLLGRSLKAAPVITGFWPKS